MEGARSSHHAPGPLRGGKVAIFAPHPLLSVTIEARGGEDDIHLHAAGQGTWVARMAAELGASPVLCSLIGGEAGAVLEPLLATLPGEHRLVRSAGRSGSYVVDRRDGERRLLASSLSPAPSRHEVDDLVSKTCAAALASDVLAICNPFPPDALPLEVYGNLVSDARANGTPVIVDLSSPRLDSALAGGPDLVKLNDWELAEFVRGPVSEPEERESAISALLAGGAGSVLVTRGGESAFAARGEERFELVPPRFDRGYREGCGDSMMGALAAGLAQGIDWLEAITLGAAAGATNFLRHGLGTGSGPVVRELVETIEVRPLVRGS